MGERRLGTIDETLGQAGVAAVLANQEGYILRVNTTFEHVFGWTSPEILGQPLTVIIPANLRDAHHMGVSRFLLTGRPTLLNRALALKAVTKDGRVFDAEHFIVAEQRDGQWLFAATIRPVAARP